MTHDLAAKIVLYSAALLAAVPPRAMGAASLAHAFKPAAIYGCDGRRDLYAVSDPFQRELARSVVSLFFILDVELDKSGDWAHLDTQPFAEGASKILTEDDLCPGERFRDQRTGSRCSGVLVAPDIVATAGHCVEDARTCGNTRFVFGFALESRGGPPDVVPANDVYGCRELIAAHPNYKEENGPDWALVRLDRPVTDRKPAAINLTGEIEPGAPVFVIGNPANLPLKAAGGARVRESHPEYFIANLDTYHGNSGSPVFNEISGVVEGLLARGEEDWELKGDCWVSKVFPEDGGQGETVSKASLFAPLIPQTASASAYGRPEGDSRFMRGGMSPAFKTLEKLAVSGFAR